MYIYMNIYIYILWRLRARYRERFVSPRIPRKSSGDHPWIPDFEAKSHDSGPQNTSFEPAFTSFLLLFTIFNVFGHFEAGKKIAMDPGNRPRYGKELLGDP